MKEILEMDIISLLENKENFRIGNTLFREHKYSDAVIDIKDSNFKLSLNVDNFKVNLDVIDSSISTYFCSCEKKDICEHIVCGINIYNESIKFDLDLYKNLKDLFFVVKPVLINNDDTNWSIRVFVNFATDNYNKINISNIYKLFEKENEFKFFMDFSFLKEQLDYESVKLLDDFKNMLISTNIVSHSNYFDLNANNIDEWLAFFNKHNIQISLNNEDLWLITEYNFGNSKYDWEVGSAVKPFVNNKKKYTLKGLKDFDYFSIVSNNYSYLLMLNRPKSQLFLYQYELLKEKNINDFIENINKSVAKNNFYKLYLAIKNLFWNYEKIINSVYVLQQGLSRIDPILEIKVFFHEMLNILVAKFSFIYGETIYPYVVNEINYFKRERFLEKKLLDEALVFFPYYNSEFQVFEIIEHQKLLEFQSWAIKKHNDDFFSIKAEEGLIFKQKKKKKFYIQSTRFDNDLLKIDWSLEDFSNEDMIRILTSYVKKIKYVKLSNGKEMNIDSDIDIESLKEELKSYNTSIEDLVEKNETQLSAHNANFFASLNPNMVDEETKNKILEKYDLNDVENELPDNLKNLLKDYQIKGYKWLKKLIQINAGGILADEMGLGKTMQTISIIADTYFNKRTELPTLIICPSSLVYNWSEEIKKFAPFLKFAIIDGNQFERSEIIRNANKYNVIITSLNLLTRDLKNYENVNFYLQIVDEAQRIKSHSALISKNVKEIKSLHRFALTGTPIENNLSELWSIFDYLMPNYLHDYKTFKYLYEDKIIGKDDLAVKKLRVRIDPFILRRTKKEVLKELPEKTTKILTCEFDDEQKQLYLTELQKSKLEIQNTIENSKENKNAQVFQVLTKLRLICCSPKIIYENSSSNGTKFRMCMDLIDDLIQNGSRILLFSQFVKMLDIISNELTRRKIPHLKLTGDCGKKERQEMVEKFNSKENIKIFLISLKAGGVGLTLTSADTVIHYDPWWNISLENQATDRAHRIGQKKNVNIYKLISKDSIEEKVLKLQETKLEIFNQIFDENNFGTNTNNKISMEQILDILDIKD